VEHTEEQAERDEARAQGRDRHDHEPAEPLADGGTELALDSRADPGQNRSHVIPSFTGGPGGHPVTSTVREHPGAGDGWHPGCAWATLSRTRASCMDCGPLRTGFSASPEHGHGGGIRGCLPALPPHLPARSAPKPGQTGQAGRPIARPRRMTAWLKYPARSVTTFSNWPNSSKLTSPKTLAQVASARAATSSDTPGRTDCRRRAASGAKEPGGGGPSAGGSSTPPACAS